MDRGIYEIKFKIELKKFSKRKFSNFKENFMYGAVDKDGNVIVTSKNYSRFTPNICMVTRFGKIESLKFGDMIAIYPDGLEKFEEKENESYKLVFKGF